MLLKNVSSQMHCSTGRWGISLSEICIIYQNVLHENSWI